MLSEEFIGIISERFNTADWKAYRLVCRQTERLFQDYCCSFAMVAGTGKCLGLKDAVCAMPVHLFPITDRNRRLFMNVLKAQMEGKDLKSKILMFGTCKFEFTLMEALYLFGDEFDDVVDLMREMAHTESGYEAVCEACHSSDETLLRYLIYEDVAFAHELMCAKRIKAWDIYETRGCYIFCYPDCRAENSDFLVELLTRGILFSPGPCADCLLKTFERTGHQYAAQLALVQLLKERMDTTKLVRWGEAAQGRVVKIEHRHFRRRKAKKMIRYIHNNVPGVVIRCSDGGDACDYLLYEPEIKITRRHSY